MQQDFVANNRVPDLSLASQTLAEPLASPQSIEICPGLGPSNGRSVEFGLLNAYASVVVDSR
jgi:hypothetical protein